MTELSQVTILPIGEPVTIAGNDFRWVSAYNDTLDRRLAGHWRFLLDNFSTRYIRIFPLYNGMFLADNTETEEEGMECGSREALEKLVDKWVGDAKNRRWKASL